MVGFLFVVSCTCRVFEKCLSFNLGAVWEAFEALLLFWVDVEGALSSSKFLGELVGIIVSTSKNDPAVLLPFSHYAALPV